jgi:fumarate reductase flavoprotein subunit
MTSDRTEKNLRADVVVIGSGAAGLPAAVTAAEKGACVIVLEKRRATGGNGVFASGLFVVDRRMQEHTDINTLRNAFFRKAMDYAHWKIDPRIIRALIEKSGDTIAWLEEKGMRFERREFPGGMSLPFYIGPEKRVGAAVARVFTQKCRDMGVPVLRETRARKLLIGRGGRITGVLAETKGKEVMINSRSVVIATGGFAGNKELLSKYIPPSHEGDFHIKGLRHTGDGILMAAEIGAASDGVFVLEMDAPDFPHPSHFFSRLTGPRHGIWVNQKGERFTDESVSLFESANSLCRQPGKTSYTIFDEKVKQAIYEEARHPSRMGMGGDSSWPEAAENDLRRYAEQGSVKITRSWDEMARWMGAAPEVLRATVDEYNAGCDQGHDDLFAKDPKTLMPLRTPPYYAVRCCVSILVTHGGIKVNHRMEVLDKKDNPIPGLYAAGVDIAGREANTYNASLPGHSFGFSVHSGRIAGENAAQYVR